MSMSGQRSLPRDFSDRYAQYCESFTRKLHCQVLRLMGPHPSPDPKSLDNRLEELADKILQIGLLAQVGEFPVRSSPAVLRRWGIRPVEEICRFIKFDLDHIRQELDRTEGLDTATRLVGILEALPFQGVWDL